MAAPQKSVKRKRPTTSATRRTPAQSKKKQSEDPLFNSSHISGFIVGAMTGAVASLGIIAGINPTALPQSIISAQETPSEVSPQPSFTFFDTLEDESLSTQSSPPSPDSPSEYSKYVLQAGSFRAVADADRRRGELALLGLESSIEEMRVDSGSWHRIYIGPFNSRSEMAKARSLAAQSNIETLLLKRSD